MSCTLRCVALVVALGVGCGTSRVGEPTAAPTPASSSVSSTEKATPEESPGVAATSVPTEERGATTSAPAGITEEASADNAPAAVAPRVVREPVTAAELIRKIDLRKVGRISPKEVLDEGATYLYYQAQASVPGADAFYREELQAQGWQPVSKWQMASADYADRMYENDGFIVRVSIGAGGDEGVVGVGLSSLGNIDFTVLPRIDGAEILDASVPANVSYLTKRSIADVIQFCRDELPRAGWQEFSSQHGNGMDVPHHKQLSYVRNAVRLLVSISKDPRNPQQTHVGYLADSALPFDLPFTSPLSDLHIDAFSKQADYVTERPWSEVAEFYKRPRAELGWKLKDDESRVGKEGATLFVEDEPERGFAIRIVAHEGKTKVQFRRLSFRQQEAAPATTEPPVAEVATTPPSEPPAASAVDAVAAEVTKGIQSQIEAEMKKAGVDLKGLGVDLDKLLGDQPPLAKPGIPAEPTSRPEPSPREEPPQRITASSAATPLPADLTTSCRISYAGMTYELKHAVAFEKKEFDRTIPVVVFCDRPIDLEKVRRLVAAGEEVSLFEAAPRGADASLEVRMTDSTTSITCFLGNGASINISSTKIETNFRADSGRLRGQSRLPEPEDFFDKPFQFTATFELPLLVLPSGPAAEAEKNR
ncbi:MAG: hypothetical protein AB7O38_16160 [Pirellulaceae bacterium]